METNVKVISKNNENKIAFIMCVNDLRAYEEVLRYIDNLIIPEGIEVEVIKIEGASSMCSGYNEAMCKSDAKYKVYMHQDVYIVNKYFIENVLEIFKNDDIGMIGMVGSTEYPPQGIMWYGKRCGNLYTCDLQKAGECNMNNGMDYEYKEVEAIDGLMMITSIDIPWREDIFEGWDFYDISKSRDMIRYGKKVVVPLQVKPWCIHNDGMMNMDNYFKNRELFENEYGIF